jgi:hypothetical protein
MHFNQTHTIHFTPLCNLFLLGTDKVSYQKIAVGSFFRPQFLEIVFQIPAHPGSIEFGCRKKIKRYGIILDILQVRTGKIRVFEGGCVKDGATQVGTGKVGVIHIGLDKMGLSQVGTAEICIQKVQQNYAGRPQVCLSPKRLLHGHTIEISTCKVCAGDICIIQKYIFESDPAHHGISHN